MAALSGCHEFVNPWHDDTFGPEVVTTASVESVHAANPQPTQRHREFERGALLPQDGTVGHFPLWWEDPFEDRGSDDGKFAMTEEDYIAAPYGVGRMIVNTIGWPISAIVQPPVPFMVSDGITSRQALGPDHDAQWLPAGGTPTPPDILEIGAVPTAEDEAPN